MEWQQHSWLQGECNRARRSLVAERLQADVRARYEAVPRERVERPAFLDQTDVEVTGDDVLLKLGDRQWRTRGLDRNTGVDQLQINLLVRRGADTYFVDNLNLYSAAARARYIANAAGDLQMSEGVLRNDLRWVLMQLEGLAWHRVREAHQRSSGGETEPTDKDDEAAMDLLRDPRLLDRIVADFDRCHVAGDETDKLVAYLGATSRLLDRPLTVVAPNTAAVGNSALLEAVLAFVPEEARVKYSSATTPAFHWAGERGLAHKVLAVAEENTRGPAASSFKLIQAQGGLAIASTGLDERTGQVVTDEYRLAGPIAVLWTTSEVSVGEELLEHCLLLSASDTLAPTYQRQNRERGDETPSASVAAQGHPEVIEMHRAAQRLLSPLMVVNPFADQLPGPSRDNHGLGKYSALMDSVALLQQHQRRIHQTTYRGDRIRYVEVTHDDVKVANELAHDALRAVGNWSA
jgi:hypothetical protein